LTIVAVLDLAWVLGIGAITGCIACRVATCRIYNQEAAGQTRFFWLFAIQTIVLSRARVVICTKRLIVEAQSGFKIAAADVAGYLGGPAIHIGSAGGSVAFTGDRITTFGDERPLARVCSTGPESAFFVDAFRVIGAVDAFRVSGRVHTCVVRACVDIAWIVIGAFFIVQATTGDCFKLACGVYAGRFLACVWRRTVACNVAASRTFG